MSNQPKIDDGGCAFGAYGSVSLRDYFAAFALQGVLANPEVFKDLQEEGQKYIESGWDAVKYREQVERPLIADGVYKLADAMLAARKQ